MEVFLIGDQEVSVKFTTRKSKLLLIM